MSEKVRSNHEFEISDSESRNHEKRIRDHHEKAAENVSNKHKESIDKILKKVESEADNSKNILDQHLKADQKDSKIHHHVPASGELKDRTLKQTVKNIQRELPPLEKSFSRVVHNPVVDSISEFSSKTIARPSGLLSGGVASLLVSGGALFVSRYYGYRYNFLIGILAFVGGFFIGLLVDSLLQLANRKNLTR